MPHRHKLKTAFRTLADLFRDRKHRLQIFTFTFLPSWCRVCLCTLAMKRVLVWRLEWLTLLPLIPDLRQISHLITDKSSSANAGAG